MLRDLLEEVAHRRDVEREAACELVGAETAIDDRLDVGCAVGERVGDLLNCVAARLAEVVAADRDRVEARQLAGRVLDHVGDEPQRRRGRVDVGLAGEELLEDVVLHGSPELGRLDALPLADDLVHGQEDRRGRVDRERRRDLIERNAREDLLHVAEGVDRDADLADLTGRELVIRVEAHLGRQVERDRESGLALPEQVAEALVRVLRAAPAGVQPHREEPAAVHARMDPARERILTGDADPLERIRRQVELRVERSDRDAGVGHGFGDVAGQLTPARDGPLELGAGLGDRSLAGRGHGLVIYRISPGLQAPRPAAAHASRPLDRPSRGPDRRSAAPHRSGALHRRSGLPGSASRGVRTLGAATCPHRRDRRRGRAGGRRRRGRPDGSRAAPRSARRRAPDRGARQDSAACACRGAGALRRGGRRSRARDRPLRGRGRRRARRGRVRASAARRRCRDGRGRRRSAALPRARLERRLQEDSRRAAIRTTAFAEAAHVTAGVFRGNRYAAVPIEARGCARLVRAGDRGADLLVLDPVTASAAPQACDGDRHRRGAHPRHHPRRRWGVRAEDPAPSRGAGRCARSTRDRQNRRLDRGPAGEPDRRAAREGAAHRERARARPGWGVPRAAGENRRRCRRVLLQQRERADRAVPLGRSHAGRVPDPEPRLRGAGRPDEQGARRPLPRGRLDGGPLRARASDRPGCAGARHRSRRAAPAQHGASGRVSVRVVHRDGLRLGQLPGVARPWGSRQSTTTASALFSAPVARRGGCSASASAPTSSRPAGARRAAHSRAGCSSRTTPPGSRSSLRAKSRVAIGTPSQGQGHGTTIAQIVGRRSRVSRSRT